MDENTIIVTAHVDDDAIFMGAALNTAKRVYIAGSPVRIDQIRVMEKIGVPFVPMWGFNSEGHYNWEFRDIARREKIYTETAIGNRCRWALKDEKWYYGTNTVVTHNPWGEYGHIHHRRVSDGVCKYAIRHKYTVWAPATVIDKRRNPIRWEENTCRLPTLPMESSQFEYRKDLYLAEESRLPSDLWTWYDDFPPPYLTTYIQLVDNGVDLRNRHVQYLRDTMEMYGI